jgi:carbon monoxide dehydrogenase subunit G
VAWRQELVESPFERIFAAAETEVALAAADGGTRVSLTADERLRGRFRLGGFMVRRAARRRLDDALAGLERAVGRS